MTVLPDESRIIWTGFPLSCFHDTNMPSWGRPDFTFSGFDLKAADVAERTISRTIPGRIHHLVPRQFLTLTGTGTT
ncbi:transcriptional regulators containing a DNA-binding HTH domain [Acetobacter aceti NRIC 0242]|nr:transcriptional regulators containing a DNA-binding HTH domain [Acetobacter aceti NRIC 0242]